MTTAGHDPDDWFDEPDVSDAWTTRVDRLARARQAQPAPTAEIDDWLDSTAARPPARRPRRTAVGRPVLVVAVLALALLFGILAAAGVFSSGGGNPAATTPPTVTTPHSTPPTTTTRTTPTFPVPTGTLKPGDSGTPVKQLQRALAHLGYSPGAADGSYGDGTKSAVERFQTAHGLTADGVAGAKTLAALAAALRSG
jgi:hypothetical protein